jgi:hypothetical protein
MLNRIKMLGVERLPFTSKGLSTLSMRLTSTPPPEDKAHARPHMAGEEQVGGGWPPDDGASHQGDHGRGNHHRAPEGRPGQPENQKPQSSQGSLDKGHDHRAPEGGLDGELGLPEDFLVVGGLQRGKLLDLVDKVVALQEGRFAGPGSQCWKIPGPGDFSLDISYYI